MPKENLNPLPKVIAIIMDGNRTHSRLHGFDELKGHQVTARERIEPLVDTCLELGYVTNLILWAFSTDNWKRSDREVSALLGLFGEAIQRETEVLHKKGVRLKTLGDLTAFPKNLQEGAKRMEELTKNNTQLTVSVGLNYGGVDEMMRAIHLLSLLKPKEIAEITDEEFLRTLDTKDMPDPDLVIRTGGQIRTSGFMPLQTRHSEWVFTDTMMPDFTPEEFLKAIEEYKHRVRKFGK